MAAKVTPPPRWVTRHGVTVVVMAAGAVVAVVGSLLPWLRTGNRRRHSYDVFALADRLGFADGGLTEQGLRWWPFVPLLTAVAVVAAWWGWRRAGSVIGIGAGLYAGGIGWSVAAAPERGLDLESGPVVTAVGGVLLLVGSLATLAVSTRGRTSPTAPER